MAPRWQTLTVRFFAAVIGAASLAALAACSSDSPPTLVYQLDSSPLDRAGVSFPVRADHFSIVPGSFPCSTRPVRITSVQLYRPTAGIRLLHWGLANRPYDQSHAAAYPRTLSKLGPYASHTVTARCHHTRWYARVGLELLRTQPGPQSFLAVRITYNSGAEKKAGYISEQFRIREPHGQRPS